MVDNNRAVFSNNYNDTANLIDYVEKQNYVFVKQRPGIDHLIYSDYQRRKEFKNFDERGHCPFAISKTPFLKRKRAFAYSKNFAYRLLFDPE